MQVAAPLYPVRLERLERYIAGIQGLIAYWPMQEQNGTVARNIAPNNFNQMNGVIDGCTIFSRGIAGRGYYFDGMNDRVTIADDSRLEGLAQATISFLMRSDDTSAYRKVLLKSDVLDFGINDLGEIFGEIVGVHNFGTIGPNPRVDSGEWVHIVLTYDGSSAIAYINGVAVETATGLSGSLGTGTGPLYFGNNGASEWHLGMLQHVFLANRALSDREVLKISQISGIA
jgi:hypothetical protein